MLFIRLSYVVKLPVNNVADSNFFICQLSVLRGNDEKGKNLITAKLYQELKQIIKGLAL